MLARELVTSTPHTCSPGDTAETVAKIMLRHDIGCVPVVQDGRPVGVITDRDITIRTAAKGRAPADVSAAEIMTDDIEQASECTPLAEAEAAMKDNRIRRLLLIDEDGVLTGVVSLGDLARVTHRDRAGAVLQKVSAV